MRHVAISRDNLQSLHGLGVADDIIEEDWSVLFDPVLSIGVPIPRSPVCLPW